jgi:hypothetical protein
MIFRAGLPEPGLGFFRKSRASKEPPLALEGAEEGAGDILLAAF